MDQVKIRMGGVPEHFNLPIHLANEEGLFQKQGIQLEWTTFKGGTGQMTKALRNNEIDVCILLTEGIITDIVRGNPSKIISSYVITPLTWGIHTGVDNALIHYDEIFDKKYAISRPGSGSHLMAIVDANSQGHKLVKDQFIKVKNIDGAIDSLTKMESDVFYWEKYTTKPFVDRGLLRRIGEYTTPWPCFMVAASNRILKEHADVVARLLRTIHERCFSFMEEDNSISLVSERYHLKYSDAERWYHSTEWALHGWVHNKMLKSVLFNLKLAGIINDETIPELVWKRN